jgi:hypothetical protein
LIVKTTLKGLFLGAALLVLSARPAAAQELSGGYALVNWNGCCAHGFMVDFAYPVYKVGSINIEALADFGWTRFSMEETDTTFGGGARFKVLATAVGPVFGQVTFGMVHWAEDAVPGFTAFSGSDFIMGFGGGTIIKATRMIGIKPQVDFFILPSDDDWFVRFTVNAVIKIGK